MLVERGDHASSYIPNVYGFIKDSSDSSFFVRIMNFLMTVRAGGVLEGSRAVWLFCVGTPGPEGEIAVVRGTLIRQELR